MKQSLFIFAILFSLSNFMVGAAEQTNDTKKNEQQSKSETEKLKEKIKSLEEKNKALETAQKLSNDGE